ncbi:SDR family NAD(P)-dependent oxidoreductase [Methylocapsa acidiphila]|uniref:SDR family NAD(P)-dependent oxidoreductase n=1 Tax=Methylocapsa acidiphila TaxID=133552 RepID=UPI0003FCA818|nr:SDR family oxidoreductase [Methylocapsa acidiphila]
MNSGQPQQRRIALITGASGGIGADLARVLARHGHDLALVARSRDRLEALADEIAASGRPRPIVIALDLARPGASREVAATLEAFDTSLEILVNNAGFGLIGAFAELDPVEQSGIVDLNVRALVEMTAQFLPEIRAAKGKILNVASVVSYFPGGPGMAVYYASKAFVLSFSRALWQELRAEGVVVTALCPGVTKTGFQSRAGFGPETALNSMPAQSAAEVAEVGYRALMAGRREAVPGLLNKITVLALPFQPKTLILRIIAMLQQKHRASA